MIDPPGRRPKQTTFDPRALEFGALAGQTGKGDRYFKLDDDVLTLVVRAMVDRLPDPDRSCVLMTVMHRMPYAEAGELLGPWLGRSKPVDARTVWRWAQRGVATLQVALEDASWAAELLVGRFPPPPPSVLSTRAFHTALSSPTTLAGGTDTDAVHDDSDDGDA